MGLPCQLHENLHTLLTIYQKENNKQHLKLTENDFHQLVQSMQTTHYKSERLTYKSYSNINSRPTGGGMKKAICVHDRYPLNGGHNI